MSKIAILTAVSGALVAGSLALAGPASAHRGDAGDGSAAPAGAPATSVGQAEAAGTQKIGVGIFTGQAEAAGTQVGQAEAAGTQKIGVGIFTAPAISAGPSSITPGLTSRAAVGGEQPFGPVGQAEAA